MLAGNSVNRREFLNLLLPRQRTAHPVGWGGHARRLPQPSAPMTSWKNRFEPMMLPVWEANDDCCSLLASFPASPRCAGLPNCHAGHGSLPAHTQRGHHGELAHLLMAAAIVAVESGEEAINHRTLSMACRQPLAQPRHRGRTAK